MGYLREYPLTSSPLRHNSHIRKFKELNTVHLGGRTLGKAEMWSQRIYPGMRQSIIGSLLASQENIDRNNNCFELFGADFILDEAFKPWLIEINSCPSTIGTTSVTARMTAQCLEDVIKVVIDRRTDRKADTGMFELIFKQHIPPAPPYHSVSLSVRGQKMCKEDITKLGLYRGSVKRTNKVRLKDSEMDTPFPDCIFSPGSEVAEPYENMCPAPDTVNVTPRIETNPSLEMESFLCSTAIFSCDDASHENKSEEAAENEQTSKVTSEKNAAHVTTQKILKNTDNKCNTVRHTNGSTSNRIFDDQNRTATSPLQLAQKPRHYFQHCQKINLNSNVETKFVITKQLSSPEKLINKGISPTYFNTIGASPKHGNKTKILPTHMNKNETSATRINNNGTLSTQLNKNGTSLTRFNEIGTSPTHFNKNETSHTHFNENETSPEVFNKTEISPIHTKETGSSPPTYNNKDGRSPIHKKYGEDKEIKHAEVIKEKIMWRSQEQANVITETREAMPVRKVLQEVARKNEKIMDKKVKHLSNTNFVGKNILEKNTSVGGAANLPTQYHKQAENTTTMQTKLQLYTISENTEENSMDKLWVRDVEKEDRHLSDEDSQIKKHNSNTWKNSGSALRATEVYNQWIQKLAQTKLSYEKLLNTLQIFKESENTTKNTKNSSSEKLPFTWNNGLSHRQVIKNILKRYHTDQELPDFELRGSQVSTEDICSGDQPKSLWNTSISYLSMLQENAVLKSRPTENCNISFTTKKFRFAPQYSNLYRNSNHPSRLMLPQIKQKIEMSPDDSNAIAEPVNEFYAIGMSLKALQSGITENIILPLGSEHCSEVKSLIPHVNTVTLLACHQGDPGSISGWFTPHFRTWESCRTMPAISGFSRGSPVSPTLSFRRCFILTSITLGSQDIVVKRGQNLSTPL
ncbi:hypothetical protein PR048_031427 [Dryococelus australis]|uniref:Uncharacterized protein n=1 Tax=Dryococelus australis TaxID=614101 RepID=A0ABQ9G582_9NEOP|nr:hypothetical protein PR048_031427 [Dryococelus australis]